MNANGRESKPDERVGDETAERQREWRSAEKILVILTDTRVICGRDA